jgi:hypothetical protein
MSEPYLDEVKSADAVALLRRSCSMHRLVDAGAPSPYRAYAMLRLNVIGLLPGGSLAGPRGR